jgi:hypothetical protein
MAIGIWISAEVKGIAATVPSAKMRSYIARTVVEHFELLRPPGALRPCSSC